MLKQIKYISTLFLVVLVLFSTGGFKIYSHECNCCQAEEVSLIDPDSCCEAKADMAICESEENQLPSCCSNNDQDQKNDSQCSRDDCCSIESEFFKLGNSFEMSKNLKLKTKSVYLILFQFIRTEIADVDFAKKLMVISENSPPKIPYKNFVVFAHTLKIPF